MSSSIFRKDYDSYVSILKSIIQKEASVENRDKLNEKLTFFASFKPNCWNAEQQERYEVFMNFIDNQDFDLLTKMDLVLTYGIMMNHIPMMTFDDYSNEALMLCSSVMKDFAVCDYYFVGSFLCNKQIVDLIIEQQNSLEKQLKIYQDSIDGCVTCLSDFLVFLNLKKIINNDRLYDSVILIMNSLVSRYVSYMNLSEGEIQSSLRKKCGYGIK